MRDTYFMPKRNRVTVNCGQCGAELSKPPSLVSKRNFCNMKCLGLYRRTNPTTDSTQMHTPEVHEKIRQARLANPPRGEKNGMFGRRHSDETRAKQSEAKTRLIIEGKFKPYETRCRNGDHKSDKAGRTMHYRSGWEFAVMKHLDVNPDVMTYEYESVRVSYRYNDNKRWHVPDFIITFHDGRREMWEVKPETYIDTEKVKLKSEAARVYCEQNGMRYLVFTRQVLRERGIIP